MCYSLLANRTFRTFLLTTILSLFLQASLPSGVFAEGQAVADNFSEMFTEGKAYLNFRYRYEYVDQADITKSANASTLRTRLGFETAKYEDFSALMEI
ncbi:MAG: hypothetical protein R3A13_00865 [Bdellovibrionota bacterium]